MRVMECKDGGSSCTGHVHAAVSRDTRGTLLGPKSNRKVKAESSPADHLRASKAVLRPAHGSATSLPLESVDS